MRFRQQNNSSPADITRSGDMRKPHPLVITHPGLRNQQLQIPDDCGHVEAFEGLHMTV